jgi:hypothetical protein
MYVVCIYGITDCYLYIPHRSLLADKLTAWNPKVCTHHSLKNAKTLSLKCAEYILNSYQGV